LKLVGRLRRQLRVSTHCMKWMGIKRGRPEEGNGHVLL
jgi:hypothetical protein